VENNQWGNKESHQFSTDEKIKTFPTATNCPRNKYETISLTNNEFCGKRGL
jgi:hypothetical protein